VMLINLNVKSHTANIYHDQGKWLISIPLAPEDTIWVYLQWKATSIVGTLAFFPKGKHLNFLNEWDLDGHFNSCFFPFLLSHVDMEWLFIHCFYFLKNHVLRKVMKVSNLLIVLRYFTLNYICNPIL
jgi:hypothetical protein